jgi:hypothetical protein
MDLLPTVPSRSVYNNYYLLQGLTIVQVTKMRGISEMQNRNCRYQLSFKFLYLHG